MITTVTQSWNEFCAANSGLMGQLLPALQRLDQDTIAWRTLDWSILPQWEQNAFIFELYADQPQTTVAGGEQIQLLVTDVPWDEIRRASSL